MANGLNPQCERAEWHCALFIDLPLIANQRKIANLNVDRDSPVPSQLLSSARL